MKKGAMWPITLINTVFSVLLFIIGMLMLGSLVKDVSLDVNTQVFTASHSLFAARLVNSANCWAYEEPYVENGKTKYQVHYGIIDYAKLSDASRLSCINNKEIGYSLQTFDGAISMLVGEKVGKGALNFLVRVHKDGKFHDGILRLLI